MNPPAVIRRVDHVVVRAGDVDEVRYFVSLFADTLGLPVAWPPTQFPGFFGGAVFLGNINLEFNWREGGTLPAPRFFNIIFEPAPLAEAIAEMELRGIVHGATQPFITNDAAGKPQTFWTIVGLPSYGTPRTYAALCEYTPLAWQMMYPQVKQAEQVAAMFQEELRKRSGGALGLQHAAELVVGEKDYADSLVRWRQLLDPIVPHPGGCWALADGLSLSVVPAAEHGLQALTLKVASLASATDFLQANGLFGNVSGDTVALNSEKLRGLDIRLV